MNWQYTRIKKQGGAFGVDTEQIEKELHREDEDHD